MFKFIKKIIKLSAEVKALQSDLAVLRQLVTARTRITVYNPLHLERGCYYDHNEYYRAMCSDLDLTEAVLKLATHVGARFEYTPPNTTPPLITLSKVEEDKPVVVGGYAK